MTPADIRFDTDSARREVLVGVRLETLRSGDVHQTDVGCTID